MTIFSAEQPVSEMTATDLRRATHSLLDRVADGERFIVTRNRRAVALIVSLEDGIEIMLAGDERFALLRRESRDELQAGLTEAVTAWRISSESL